ncbi:MAG: hypothetical protein CME26_12170 [Gemmatimonadetes bacterium]|nr:hypothetical protein [Gemmatimonadota bacterium]
MFVGLFTLIGLREALRPKPRGPWIIVCVLSALLSKESGLILPVLLVLVDLIWISSESKARFAVRRFCQVHLWSIGALATWLVFRWRATGSLGHVRPSPLDNPLINEPVSVALCTLPRQVFEYVRLLSYPARLSVDYGFSQIEIVRSPDLWGIGLMLLASSSFVVRSCPPLRSHSVSG